MSSTFVAGKPRRAARPRVWVFYSRPSGIRPNGPLFCAVGRPNRFTQHGVGACPNVAISVDEQGGRPLHAIADATLKITLYLGSASVCRECLSETFPVQAEGLGIILELNGLERALVGEEHVVHL